MSLLDGLSNSKKVWPCRIRTLSRELGELDKKRKADEIKDQEIFDKAVLDLSWKSETLSRALAVKGITIAGAVITRHRKKECSCSNL